MRREELDVPKGEEDEVTQELGEEGRVRDKEKAQFSATVATISGEGMVASISITCRAVMGECSLFLESA